MPKSLISLSNVSEQVWTDEDACPVRLVAYEKLGAQGEIVLHGDLYGRRRVVHLGFEVCRQSRLELVLVIVDCSVLVVVGNRESYPHSGVFVRLNNAAAGLVQPGVDGQTSQGAVVVHDRGDARLYHLHCAVKGIQVGVYVPVDEPSYAPGLQWMVQRA